jgi:hypothetical protein
MTELPASRVTPTCPCPGRCGLVQVVNSSSNRSCSSGSWVECVWGWDGLLKLSKEGTLPFWGSPNNKHNSRIVDRPNVKTYLESVRRFVFVPAESVE